MPAEFSSPRLIASVTLTALLTGLCLSGVYEWAAPRIAANQAEATKRAIFRVLPGTDSYQELQPGMYRGFDADGNSIGLALAAEGAGFGGTLELLFGFNPDSRKVVGLAVLASLETPGLGDKIETDAAFTGSFLDLAVDPTIACTAKPDAPNQVDSISGATISSKAVVRIINQRLSTLEDNP